MDQSLKEYRDHLVISEQEAQRDFDKTVFALSGGAIGISFAFITDIVSPDEIVNIGFLVISWAFWAISLLCVLFSYYFSHLALKKTINQVDDNKVRDEHPGGWFDKVTAWLNDLGAILFVSGLISIITFVYLNLGG